MRRSDDWTPPSPPSSAAIDAALAGERADPELTLIAAEARADAPPMSAGVRRPPRRRGRAWLRSAAAPPPGAPVADGRSRGCASSRPSAPPPRRSPRSSSASRR